MKKEHFSLERVKNSKNYELYKKDIDWKIELAGKVFEKRKELKLSQKDLAKKTRTTQSIISEIESADYNPGFGLLCRIFEILQMNSQELAEIFNSSVLVTEFSFDFHSEGHKIDEIGERLYN